MPNEMFDLSSKVAIVTGGNGGIGLSIARGLAMAGADIVVAARNQQKIGEAVEHLTGLGVNTLGISTDVSDLALDILAKQRQAGEQLAAETNSILDEFRPDGLLRARV